MRQNRPLCAPQSPDAARTTLRGRAAAAAVLIAAAGALAGCDVIQLAQSASEPAPEVVEVAEVVEVVAVVDGDTIDVRTDDGTERVRLIGLNSPEIGRDGSQNECYAEEARDVLNELLYGHDVQLAADPTQADRDVYGRLLRHVFLDGRSAAVEVIAAGAAYEYTYDADYEHQAEHIAAEDDAAGAARGLWGAC